jgi:hypothetical protein
MWPPSSESTNKPSRKQAWKQAVSRAAWRNCGLYRKQEANGKQQFILFLSPTGSLSYMWEPVGTGGSFCPTASKRKLNLCLPFPPVPYIIRNFGMPTSVCHVLDVRSLLDLFFQPEVGGGMVLRNIGWLSTDYTTLQPRSQTVPFRNHTIHMRDLSTSSFFFRDNAVGVVVVYGLDVPGSIPRSLRFSSSPQRPGRLWGTCSLSNGYRG